MNRAALNKLMMELDSKFSLVGICYYGDRTLTIQFWSVSFRAHHHHNGGIGQLAATGASVRDCIRKITKKLNTHGEPLTDAICGPRCPKYRG